MGLIESSIRDLGPLLNRVTVSMFVIAAIVVGLRFFTRVWIVRKVGLDDFFIAGAMILGTVQMSTILLQVKHGRGRHAQDLTVEQYNTMLKYNWINLQLYFVVNWSLKMSILALYHRIGSGKKGLPWILKSKVIWTLAILITLFSISIFLTEIFSCIPVSRSWDVEKTPRGCIDSMAFNLAQGSINVLTDLILLLYPLPLIQVLKINTRQRTALVMIFAIGIVPLAASVMRLCDIALTPIREHVSWREADTSWQWSWVPVWSEIEVDVGIVMASLPSLSPLLRKMWSGFFTYRTPTQIRELPKPRKAMGLEALGSRTHSTSSIEARKDAHGLALFEQARIVEEGMAFGGYPDHYEAIGIAKTTSHADEAVYTVPPPAKRHSDQAIDGGSIGSTHSGRSFDENWPCSDMAPVTAG